MNFIFPSDMMNASQVDEMFADEYLALQASGHNCHLLNSDAWMMDSCKIIPILRESFTSTNEISPIIYRGWMMSADEYQRLEQGINKKSRCLINNTMQYKTCHHLPNWYQACIEFTPKTVVIEADKINETDFDSILNELNWQSCFVKDYVKSLTMERGSIAQNSDEIVQIMTDIDKFRDGIEGGICLREVESFQSDSEERYFIYQGKPYARNSELNIPSMLFEIAKRIDSPFFSADVILNTDNEPRLVELGDGQVSDIKKWDVEDFVGIFG